MGNDVVSNIKLFTPLSIRGVTTKNRIAVSPMCQYSAKNDGHPTPWHLVHLGTRAVGGAGLVMAEATAVTPRGRISPWDLGIWDNDHVHSFLKITDFIKTQGSIPAIQLAHAGRKGSRDKPWNGGTKINKQNGGWSPVAPSAIPFDDDYDIPIELSTSDIEQIINDFSTAATRSINAGFQVIELHFAHGYLACEFMSPLSNKRKDCYGGSLDNRIRFPLEVCAAVRRVVPDNIPLFMRISATEHVENGWDINHSIYLSNKASKTGVDLVDCSSGGNSQKQTVVSYPGYQVSYAKEIKEKTDMYTGAVGMITDPIQANNIIETGEADIVLLGRELLRNPYWPTYAKKTLTNTTNYPNPYSSIEKS
jgi:2,4-dienoyl-CoA reductase-like NADH-dependent reductase (Old Yellow Enzyme family)